MIGSDPNSYYHFRKDPRWKAAMDEEFNSLRKNATWELVSLTPGRKLVQCKWVYQKKVVVDGKDGFHKTSFVHRRIQALGGASHGCQE